MLKEAIEKIQEMAQPLVYQNGKSYISISSDGNIQEYGTKEHAAETLKVYSLDGLVKMVKHEGLIDYDPPLFVSVPDHLTVLCYTRQLGYSDNYYRPTCYIAKATDVPGWDENVQMSFGEMQIALRTRFQETQDAVYALKILSDITTGAKVTFNDNGVATSVVTQKGVALQSNETIRPIVKLKPYRTFQEVDQPESQFLIRISERGIRFAEADGGMWKMKARRTIKEYLESALKEEIQKGEIVVML